MRPDAYVAPAARVLTVLHCPDWSAAAGVTEAPSDGWTVCGKPMLVDELWMPVEAREGDQVCPGCLVPGRAAEDVQEALL